MPLVYINDPSKCDMPSSIKWKTPLKIGMTSDAYLEFWTNICQVFKIERNSSLYTDNKYSISANKSASFNDFSLDEYVTI